MNASNLRSDSPAKEQAVRPVRALEPAHPTQYCFESKCKAAGPYPRIRAPPRPRRVLPACLVARRAPTAALMVVFLTRRHDSHHTLEDAPDDDAHDPVTSRASAAGSYPRVPELCEKRHAPSRWAQPEPVACGWPAAWGKNRTSGGLIRRCGETM